MSDLEHLAQSVRAAVRAPESLWEDWARRLAEGVLALSRENEEYRAWAKQALSSAMPPCTVHPEFSPGCMNCVVRRMIAAEAERDALAEKLRASEADLRAVVLTSVRMIKVLHEELGPHMPQRQRWQLDGYYKQALDTEAKLLAPEPKP